MKYTLNSAMTKNIKTVLDIDSLDTAYLAMKNMNIRHLVVVNIQGEVCGMLSDRDLQRAMVSEVKRTGDFRTEDCEFNPQHQVKDYMSWPVKTLDTQTSLKTVTEMMIKEKVSAYLITTNKEVSGIITSEDLLKVLSKILNTDKESIITEIENFLMNPTIGSVAQSVSDIGI